VRIYHKFHNADCVVYYVCDKKRVTDVNNIFIHNSYGSCNDTTSKLGTCIKVDRIVPCELERKFQVVVVCNLSIIQVSSRRK
jgi:hypothetical protein